VVLMFLFGIFMRGVMFTPEKGPDYLTFFLRCSAIRRWIWQARTTITAPSSWLPRAC
jgi:hypothetical protein